jgi:hypothetical protein
METIEMIAWFAIGFISTFGPLELTTRRAASKMTAKLFWR